MLQAIPSLAKLSSNSDNTPEEEELHHHPSQVAANMTSTSDMIQLEMLRLLKELSNDIKVSRAVPNQDRSGQGSRHETRKTPKEGGKIRKNISKYY